MSEFYNNHHNKYRKKIYRAKLDNCRSRIIGWPKFYHQKEKKTLWEAVRAMLF